MILKILYNLNGSMTLWSVGKSQTAEFKYEAELRVVFSWLSASHASCRSALLSAALLFRSPFSARAFLTHQTSANLDLLLNSLILHLWVNEMFSQWVELLSDLALSWVLLISQAQLLGLKWAQMIFHMLQLERALSCPSYFSTEAQVT